MKTNKLYQCIADCVAILPPDTLDSIVNGIQDLEQAPRSWQRTDILNRVPALHAQKLVMAFLDTWRTDFPKMDGKTAAMLFQSAAVVQKNQPSIPELIWSGPDKHAGKFRRTDQALLDVIQCAEKELLIVSFAAYREKTIWDALKSAINRGVKVRFFLEDSDDSDSFSGDITKAFPDKDFKKAEFYHWPAEKRDYNGDGKKGAMHAKAVVADHRYLYISSANLTGSAMDQNIELGVVLDNPQMAKDVCELFDNMCIDQIMEPFQL